MDEGDLVVAIISLIGLVAFVALIAVDEWRNRTKPPGTPQAT
jgi:hypothetical protein